MSLNDFLLFLFLKVCASYVAVVQQMLWFLPLHINYMKFIWKTRRNSHLDKSKLKLHGITKWPFFSRRITRYYIFLSFFSLHAIVLCTQSCYVFNSQFLRKAKVSAEPSCIGSLYYNLVIDCNSFQRRIRNPVRHLRWSILRK